MDEIESTTRAKCPIPLLNVDPANLDTSKEYLKMSDKKQGTIRFRLSDFKTYMYNFQAKQESGYFNLQIKELSLKVAQLQELSVSFDCLQTEIEELSENLVEQIAQHEITESEFISQIA